MNPKVSRVEQSRHAVSSSAQRPVPAKGASLECPPARTKPKPSAPAREIIRDEDRPLRLKAIAAETQVSEKTVRRWIDLRGLPSMKLGGLRVVLKRDLLVFLGKQPVTQH